MKNLIFIVAFWTASALAYDGTDYASACSPPLGKSATSPVNKMTMAVAHSMEKGRGYMKKVDGKYQDGPIIERLQNSVGLDNCNLRIQNKMEDSFCSAGTYLAFLKVIEQAQNSGAVKLNCASANALLPKNKNLQPDGVGVWGQWNSDGQGTAVVLNQLGMAQNTHDVSQAEQGDFAKIDWKSGDGHSVIFDSMRNCKKCPSCASEQSVCYWSVNISNDTTYMADGDNGRQDGGWGLKCRPKSAVGSITISHIKNLSDVNNAGTNIGSGYDNPNYRNPFLVSGARVTSAQMDQLAGIGIAPNPVFRAVADKSGVSQ